MKSLDDPGFDPKWRTGKPCIEVGCDEPAGTAWGPHWCPQHDAERLERISRQLDEMVVSMGRARPSAEAPDE